jgi:hypothetical protein
MIEKLKKYEELSKERNKILNQIRKILVKPPVEYITIYEVNSIRFATDNYYAIIDLNGQRDDVKIYKKSNANILPTSDSDIAEYMERLTIEKQGFKKHIDNLFKAI